jgi:plasmid stability protein
MANINVDDSLLTLLKADAKSHGVKVEARAEHILREALRPVARRLSLREQANEIAAMTPKGVAQTPADILIREDRDR